MIRFAKGDVLVVDNNEYEFIRRLPDKRIQIENTESREPQCWFDEEICEMILDGKAVRMPGLMTQRTKSPKNSIKNRDFNSYPENLKKEARRKIKYLKELLRRGHIKYSRVAVLQDLPLIAVQIKDLDGPPSYSALCDWRKKAGASLDIRELVPKHHLKGNSTERLRPDVVEIIDRQIREYYMTEECPSFEDVCVEIRAKIDQINEVRIDVNNKLETNPSCAREGYEKQEILVHPSYWAVREAILRMDGYDIMASRKGKAAADAHFAAVGLGPIVKRLMDLVEADHTKLDLFVVDSETGIPIGRPWIVIMVDRCSRMPVGVHITFDPPSAQTLLQCLKNTLRPKTYVKKFKSVKNTWRAYGKMYELHLDRAMENFSEAVEDACDCLGIHVRFSPRKKPWFKGIVERYFKTQNQRFLHKVKGTTFSNFIDKGEYDSQKNAIVSYELLVEMVHKFIIDVFAQHPHRWLKDIPALYWDEKILEDPVPYIDNVDELDTLIGHIDKRNLSKKGIEFENLRYCSDEIVQWLRNYDFRSNSEKTKTGYFVKIKYDPTDISRLWVLHPSEQKYYPLPCLEDEYAKGVSLWQHKNICEYIRCELKLKVDLAALDRAKVDLRLMWEEMIGRGKGKRKKVGSAQRAARGLAIGRREASSDQVTSKPPKTRPDVTADQPKLNPSSVRDESDKKRFEDFADLQIPSESDDKDVYQNIP